MNAQTAAATSNRSDATASAWIAEPVRGMSGLLGLGGLARLIWLDWPFWLGDGFDVHCYLRVDFIMTGGTELRVRSPIGGFSIACCSDGDGLAYRIKCLSLGDCLQRELDLLVQSLQLLGIRYETIVGNTVQFGSGEV